MFSEWDYATDDDDVKIICLNVILIISRNSDHSSVFRPSITFELLLPHMICIMQSIHILWRTYTNLAQFLRTIRHNAEASYLYRLFWICLRNFPVNSVYQHVTGCKINSITINHTDSKAHLYIVFKANDVLAQIDGNVGVRINQNIGDIRKINKLENFLCFTDQAWILMALI